MAKRKRQYKETLAQLNDEELRTRIEQRRRAQAGLKRRKRAVTLLVFIVAFALLGTMCGRDIVRLRSENHALKKQQTALEKQRDELKEELKNTNSQEYIREQARKQLRLLNPGEILFTFDDEEDDKDSGEDVESKEDKADGSKDSGGSDG